jgi:hypothetical protein
MVWIHPVGPPHGRTWQRSGHWKRAPPRVVFSWVVRLSVAASRDQRNIPGRPRRAERRTELAVGLASLPAGSLGVSASPHHTAERQKERGVVAHFVLDIENPMEGCGARSPRPPLGRLASIVLSCLLLANDSGITPPLIPTRPSLPPVLGPVKEWPGNDVTWRTTWPTAILDRPCARRPREPRGSGRKDGLTGRSN